MESGLKPSVLVVDDDTAVLTTFVRALEDRYEVASASGVEAAIELVGANDYDAIIIDQRMPGRAHPEHGGWDVLAHVTRHCPSSPALVVTGYASLENAVAALRMGAFDYVVKPITLEALQESLARALEFRRALDPVKMMGLHRGLRVAVAEMANEASRQASQERLERGLRKLERQIDTLFKAVRGWERVVVDHRETLARVQSKTEQLVEQFKSDDPIREQVEQLAALAARRI